MEYRVLRSPIRWFLLDAHREHGLLVHLQTLGIDLAGRLSRHQWLWALSVEPTASTRRLPCDPSVVIGNHAGRIDLLEFSADLSLPTKPTHRLPSLEGFGNAPHRHPGADARFRLQTTPKPARLTLATISYSVPIPIPERFRILSGEVIPVPYPLPPSENQQTDAAKGKEQTIGSARSPFTPWPGIAKEGLV